MKLGYQKYDPSICNHFDPCHCHHVHTSHTGFSFGPHDVVHGVHGVTPRPVYQMVGTCGHTGRNTQRHGNHSGSERGPHGGRVPPKHFGPPTWDKTLRPKGLAWHAKISMILCHGCAGIFPFWLFVGAQIIQRRCFYAVKWVDRTVPGTKRLLHWVTQFWQKWKKSCPKSTSWW